MNASRPSCSGWSSSAGSDRRAAGASTDTRAAPACRIPAVAALIEDVSRELGIQRRNIPDEEILDRLLHPLVNEGAKIVADGTAIRASDIDIVYVNGYGFPAFRGGPMYWAEQIGFTRIIATMQRLAATHGRRWAPAPLLETLAASGQGWSALRGSSQRPDPS